MRAQQAQSSKKSGPTIENSPRAREALGKTMDAINRYAATRRLISPPSDKLTKAQQEIAQYFRGQFRGSPSLSKALEDLSAEKLKMASIDLTTVVTGTPISGLKPADVIPVPALVVDRTPPYEQEWVWGNQGKHEKNKSNGLIGIWGSCGGVSQEGVPDQDADHLDGATGITVLVTTDKTASVQVTATVLNHWAYLIAAHGGFSHADVAGGIDMAAFLNGNPIDGPRRDTLFSDSVNDFNEVSHTGNGVEKVTVNFSIHPGDVVGVPFGVWLTCNHSSGVGSAGATGAMTAQVVFVEITEKFTS
jgi:hypothetical protein